MYQKKISLADLVNLEDWQKMQESFSEVLGITLRTINSSGKSICKLSGPSALLTKILKNKKNPSYSKLCTSCMLKPPIEKRITMEETTNINCPFGLEIFAIPIKAFGNRTVTFMLVGPVIMNKRKAQSDYAKAAKKAGVNVEEVMEDLIEINVFSYSRMRAIVALLKDIFSHMAQTGYHKKRLGEIAPEVMEIDPLFSRYYEEKLLNAFLKSCMLALDADSGSVMTVDPETRHLHIQAASKLDREIVENTDMRVGEGIAGMALANAEPIVLPQDRNKNGLSKKMKRKKIKSSLIMPFNKANTHEAYGVISLNVIRKDREFSGKDLALVRELTKLSSIALAPVK